MSRSKHGGKSLDYEYWSKRPCNGISPGRWGKTKTHRLERLEAKRTIKAALNEDTGYCNSPKRPTNDDSDC